MIHWSKNEIEILMKFYSNTPNKDFAKSLNRSMTAIRTQASKLGLKKSKEYLVKVGKVSNVATQFKKGMTSWNKGLKLGSEWGGKETRFKPGQTPHNKLPEELREVSLLRRQLTKNINERLKRYDKRKKTNGA